MESGTTTRSKSWPHRLAVATFLSALPLVFFGGSVTTLGAGMAVEGWLVAEGHFLLLFPVESWFRDLPTFVEHTHRLFGVLVGLFACATLLAVLLTDRRRTALLASGLALLAVAFQGTLGGLRVLEDSPRLAFLHGALAQAVLALLCASAVLLAPRAAEAKPADAEREAGRARLCRLAAIALVVVYAQVFVGAWYRHSLRPAPAAEAGGLFLLHAIGAAAVLAVVAHLAGALARGLEERRVPRSLAAAPRRLQVLLLTQVLLGLCAWAGYRPNATGPLEWALSVAHVLCGGLLLAQVTACVVRLRRHAPEPEEAPVLTRGAEPRWGEAL